MVRMTIINFQKFNSHLPSSSMNLTRLLVSAESCVIKVVLGDLVPDIIAIEFGDLN